MRSGYRYGRSKSRDQVEDATDSSEYAAEHREPPAYHQKRTIPGCAEMPKSALESELRFAERN